MHPKVLLHWIPFAPPSSLFTSIYSHQYNLCCMDSLLPGLTPHIPSLKDGVKSLETKLNIFNDSPSVATNRRQHCVHQLNHRNTCIGSNYKFTKKNATNMPSLKKNEKCSGNESQVQYDYNTTMTQGYDNATTMNRHINFLIPRSVVACCSQSQSSRLTTSVGASSELVKNGAAQLEHPRLSDSVMDSIIEYYHNEYSGMLIIRILWIWEQRLQPDSHPVHCKQPWASCLPTVLSGQLSLLPSAGREMSSSYGCGVKG